MLSCDRVCRRPRDECRPTVGVHLEVSVETTGVGHRGGAGSGDDDGDGDGDGVQHGVETHSDLALKLARDLARRGSRVQTCL